MISRNEMFLLKRVVRKPSCCSYEINNGSFYGESTKDMPFDTATPVIIGIDIEVPHTCLFEALHAFIWEPHSGCDSI